MTSLDLEKLKFLKRKFRMLNFHKQCFPEMIIVSLRFGIQKQHFFHYPTKMPHTSKVAPLYGKGNEFWKAHAAHFKKFTRVARTILLKI